MLLSIQFDYSKAQRYVDGEKRRPSKMQARIGLEDDKRRSTRCRNGFCNRYAITAKLGRSHELKLQGQWRNSLVLKVAISYNPSERTIVPVSKFKRGLLYLGECEGSVLVNGFVKISPLIRTCSSMVEPLPSKQIVRVQFPSRAPTSVFFSKRPVAPYHLLHLERIRIKISQIIPIGKGQI